MRAPRRGPFATLLGLALLVGLALPGSSASADTTTFTVIASGSVSGEMTVEGDTRERTIGYRFNDRGRGPDLKAQVKLAADLRPQALSVAGLDYYKRPVSEAYSRNGDTAVWQVGRETGEGRSTAFYLPVESTPEHLAMLARALLKSPSGLDLALGGRARLERLTALKLDDGPVVTLYALQGLGFDARPIWLDERGELIAQGGVWSAAVRRDLVAQLPRLIAEQSRMLEARDAQRAKGLSAVPHVLALRNVAVFDARAKTVRRGWTVVTRDGVIAAAGPSATVSIPAGAMIVEGKGRSLLPGLWDMHVHVSSNAQGLLHLAAGVTTVRDLANDLDELKVRRAAFDAGDLAGPRILFAGIIDGPGPLAGPTKMLAATPQELRNVIGRYAQGGYRHIKLYSSLDPSLVPVAVDEARRLGMRVSGHVPARMTMRQAVEMGFDEVHHFNFVALNFMGPEINAKTNGITRLTAVAEHAWELDVQSAEVRDFIAFLKQKGTTVDPTFSLYENNLLGRVGTPDPNLAAVIDRLPPTVRRGAANAGLAKSDADAERNARSYKTMQRLLKAFHEAGVTMVPGTDAMPGFTYHRELELWVEAGIPAGDVLQAATLGAARVAGLEGESGTIEVGKRADLVLIDGAPFDDIRDIRKVDLVVRQGRVFENSALLQHLGVAPRGSAPTTR